MKKRYAVANDSPDGKQSRVLSEHEHLEGALSAARGDDWIWDRLLHLQIPRLRYRPEKSNDDG